MKDVLLKKLHDYLTRNNPDVLVLLEEGRELTAYLENKVASVSDLTGADKPGYIVEEECMDVLTRDLRPSKFNYLSSILENEFEDAYEMFQSSGILVHELINLVAHCQPVFEQLGFNETNEDDRMLRYAVIGSVSEYLDATSE